MYTSVVMYTNNILYHAAYIHIYAITTLDIHNTDFCVSANVLKYHYIRCIAIHILYIAHHYY